MRARVASSNGGTRRWTKFHGWHNLPVAIFTKCAILASVSFSKGDLVWAKAPGFSFWPAVVIDPSEARAKNIHKLGYLPVRFFGTYDDAWLPTSTNIFPYSSAFNDNAEGSKTKKFQTAKEEAQHYLDTKELPAKCIVPKEPGVTIITNSNGSTTLKIVTSPVAAAKSKSVPPPAKKPTQAASSHALNFKKSDSDDSRKHRKRFRLLIMRQLGLASPGDEPIHSRAPPKSEASTSSSSSSAPAAAAAVPPIGSIGIVIPRSE